MSSPPVDPADAERQELAAFIRVLTLVASEIAFAGLFAYVMYVTWNAAAGKPPDISAPVQGTAAALAVALAAGFSNVLGMQPKAGVRALDVLAVLRGSATDLALFSGVFIYMAVGAACGLTYLANTDETPGLLRTVAIAFGGYVIAYIGTAYKQLSQ
ncbi:MAG TPA: hypothetical protein VLW49_03230 [Gaiellaceae bacterium]|nr:hypothetical protein [Gaiellaceae bacterium]